MLPLQVSQVVSSIKKTLATMKTATNMRTSASFTTGTSSCLNLMAWLVATLGIAGFVLALVIVLNLSSHHDIEFHINSLSVSPFIVYSSSVTANWSITLLAKNHYKDKSIYFDAMQVSVFYQKEFLTMTNVVFNETAGPKNESSVHASLVASSVFVKDHVRAAMVEDLNGGIVGFGVAMQGVVRVGGGLHWERRLLRVDCDYVKVEILNNRIEGALFGGSSICDVEDY